MVAEFLTRLGPLSMVRPDFQGVEPAIFGGVKVVCFGRVHPAPEAPLKTHPQSHRAGGSAKP